MAWARSGWSSLSWRSSATSRGSARGWGFSVLSTALILANVLSIQQFGPGRPPGWIQRAVGRTANENPPEFRRSVILRPGAAYASPLLGASADHRSQSTSIERSTPVTLRFTRWRSRSRVVPLALVASLIALPVAASENTVTPKAKTEQVSL